MDAVLDVLLVLSLAGVIAYAFAVYEALKIHDRLGQGPVA